MNLGMTPKQRSLCLHSVSQQMIVAAEEAAVCQWGTFRLWTLRWEPRSLLLRSEETRMILAAYLLDGFQTGFTKADRDEARCGFGQSETARVQAEI